MRRSKFTEQQIIGALKQVDAGAKAQDVCRNLCISEHTLYRWKAKYAGMAAFATNASMNTGSCPARCESSTTLGAVTAR